MAVNTKHPLKSEIKIEGRVAICRCWQSSKFPFCDGSHHAFNEKNSDNLGPLIVNTEDE